MEGIPGAAERRPFREGRREAALGGLADHHREFSGGGDHERVTRGVRADRVGVKLSSRAIAMRGAEREAFSSRARSLTREISAGRATGRKACDVSTTRDRRLQRRPRHVSPRKRGLARNHCASGRPKAKCAGCGMSVGSCSQVVNGCRSRQAARGPSSPRSEELPGTDGGSSPSRASGERRKSVESQPGGGKATGKGDGLPPKTGGGESCLAREHLSAEGASGRRSRAH